MRNLVLDASVIVKWFVAEPDSDRAEQLFNDEGVNIIPGHALGEIGQVLLARFKKREIGQAQFDLARRVLPAAFVVVPINEIFDRAINIALGINQTLYDALYVAAAERWETVLVTADERLVRSVGATPWAERVLPLNDLNRGNVSV